MAKGRKPSEVNMAELRLFLPQRLIDEIDIILLDPFTQKPRYGERSRIGRKLFTDWVNEQKLNGRVIDERDASTGS